MINIPSQVMRKLFYKEEDQVVSEQDNILRHENCTVDSFVKRANGRKGLLVCAVLHERGERRLLNSLYLLNGIGSDVLSHMLCFTYFPRGWAPLQQQISYS
jgi:hypothetical protein